MHGCVREQCASREDQSHAHPVQVLIDLDATRYLNPVLISEQEGIEKPLPEIFLRACTQAGVEASETLHVGDELEAQVSLLDVKVLY